MSTAFLALTWTSVSYSTSIGTKPDKRRSISRPANCKLISGLPFADRRSAQPTPVMLLVLAGMNDVINSQGYTQAAFWNRIPRAVWWLMATIALLGLAAMFGLAASTTVIRCQMLRPRRLVWNGVTRGVSTGVKDVWYDALCGMRDVRYDAPCGIIERQK